MALSTLSGDEQGIILGQLCNTLEPRLAMYFSGASSDLYYGFTPYTATCGAQRALLTPLPGGGRWPVQGRCGSTAEG